MVTYLGSLVQLCCEEGVQFTSVAQSCPTLCDPMDCSMQSSLSITNFQSLLKLMSIESEMASNNYLILCHPLLLLPSIFPSIRVFSNESALHVRWPKYRSFHKAQHSENEDHGIWSHHFMANRCGNSVRLLSFWAPKSLQMVIAAMKLKDAYSLEEKL